MADTTQATAGTVCEQTCDLVHGRHSQACLDLTYRTPGTQPSQTEELKPPRHAFEVRIAIGGNDWDYVLRTMDELAGHIREHGPECGLSSGGWGGSHSVDIETRDVTPEVYRDELEKWCITQLGGR